MARTLQLHDEFGIREVFRQRAPSLARLHRRLQSTLLLRIESVSQVRQVFVDVVAAGGRFVSRREMGLGAVAAEEKRRRVHRSTGSCALSRDVVETQRGKVRAGALALHTVTRWLWWGTEDERLGRDRRRRVDRLQRQVRGALRVRSFDSERRRRLGSQKARRPYERRVDGRLGGRCRGEACLGRGEWHQVVRRRVEFEQLAHEARLAREPRLLPAQRVERATQ